MPPIKDKANWGYIILGLVFALTFLLPGKKNIYENELDTLSVVVSAPIQDIHSRRSSKEYRFGCVEHACSFLITTSGGIAAGWNNLDNITTNDTLVIKIHNSRIDHLKEEDEDIPVYSIIKNGMRIYGVNDYNEARRGLDRRWNTIFGLMSLLMLLRGTTILSSKATWILAILSVVTIIVLRVSNSGW